MSVPSSTIGGIAPANFQAVDLETLMMMVQSQRANLLESQLKEQISNVQKNNEQISQYNTAMAALNGVKNVFGGDSSATTKIHETGDKKKGGNSASRLNEVTAIAKEALEGAGFESGMKELGDVQISTSSTMGQVDSAIQALKAKIDSLGNSQQMDMLRLQSLSNKRNEAFETMTNFVKKMQDARNSIIGNMR